MRVVAITADTSLTVTLAMMDDWEVVSAHDVDQAAEAAGFASVGLVGLGETDEGLAIVEQLSAKGVTIPFIVVGDRPAPFGTRAMVLTRPFSLDDLRAAVDQALSPVAPAIAQPGEEATAPNGAAPSDEEPEAPPPPPEGAADVQPETLPAVEQPPTTAPEPLEEIEPGDQAAAEAPAEVVEEPPVEVRRVFERVVEPEPEAVSEAARVEEPEPVAPPPDEPEVVPAADASEAAETDASAGVEQADVVRLPDVPPEPEPPMPGLPDQDDIRVVDVPDLPLPEITAEEPEPVTAAADDVAADDEPADPLDSRLVAVRRAAKVPTGVEATLLERLRVAFAAVTDLEELVEMLPVLGDPASLADSVLTEMLQDFEPETAFVAERSADGFRVVAAKGLSSVERDLPMNAEQPLLAAASEVPRGVLVEVVALASDLVDGISGVCTEALMAAPLAVEGRTVGILAVGRDRLDAADVEKLLTLALEAAPGFAIAQMIDRLRRG